MPLARIVPVLLALAAIGAPDVARAQPCTANVPHLDGQWVTLPYLMPINPISATLLHDGHVLIVSGSENDASNSPGADTYRNAVWDPTGTTQGSVVVRSIEYDVFCSGTAVLPDGRPLVVGGTSDYSFTGDSRASIFDPATSSFLQSPGMANGRWYATATALGDGRVMAFSGLASDGTTNKTVEIFDLRTPGSPWTSPVTAPFTPPLYPRMALLPNGRVFFTGQGSGAPKANSWIFDPGSRTWQASAPTTQDRRYGSAVLLSLLPPSYTPKMMNFGGGNPGTSTTETIDLSAVLPLWTPGPGMSTGRIELNAVLLPNGTVLAEGGSVDNEVPDAAGRRADLYDPVTNTVASGGAASYSRLYHSVALLLPDATVVSMGSNPSSRGSYSPAIEIYTPPYLFDGNDEPITDARPAITGVTPGPLGYNAPFSVTYTSTSPIASAVLVRPGSSTHAFDMDQRLIGLCGPAPEPPCSGGVTLALTTPPNGNVAPPGYYMLFLVDSAGMPSKAEFIQLSSFGGPPPVGTITSPASDTTVVSGDSVSFAAASGAAHYSWVFPGGTPGTSTMQNSGNVTFSTPGTYVASLTVSDASGNSDPSPPTREITVKPWTSDFEVAVSPPWAAVVPGQSAMFTVTVTPLAGFSGTVTLDASSDSGFPPGITSGGFNPPVITGGGTSTLTMNTSTNTSPYALSLTVTGTAGSQSHAAATSLLVDLEPPAALIATPGDGQVSLWWSAGAGATSYHVKRARQSGGPYASVGCTGATGYTDTGLADGVTYYYVVSSAFGSGPNAGGESADSVETSATPELAPPPAPTGVGATPGAGQVMLGWNPAPGAGNYRVNRSTTSGGPYSTIANPISTAYTDTAVSAGTTYYYVVSSLNSAGEGPMSAEVKATPSPPSTTTTTTTTATSTTMLAGMIGVLDCAGASASPPILAPADHRFVNVSIAGVRDPNGYPVTVKVTGIAQDEPLDLRHHGRCADGWGIGTANADLRAERARRGGGRVYRVSFDADDGHGGACSGTVSVCVPLRSAPGATCAKDTPSVDSTAPTCTGACAMVCRVERGLGQATCAGEGVPADLAHAIARARRMLARSTDTAHGARRVRAATLGIERAARLALDAEASGRVSPACGDSLMTLFGEARATVERLLGSPPS